LVYVIASVSRLAALLVGLALAFDLVWATSQRLILIEGPLASLQLVVLALVLYQYQNPQKLRLLALFSCGVTFALCLLFRQSNLPLLVLVPPFYYVSTRSVRKAVAVTVGIVCALGGLMALNYWRTGDSRLWAQGGWYAEFPMFEHGLFAASNGPISARLADDILKCGLTANPENIRFWAEGDNVDQGTLESCFKQQEMMRLIQSDLSLASLLDAQTARCLSSNQGNPSRIVNECLRNDKGHPKDCSLIEGWYPRQLCLYALTNFSFDDYVSRIVGRAYFTEALPNNYDRLASILFNEISKYLATPTYTLTTQYWLLPLRQGLPDYICPFRWCAPANFIPRYSLEPETIGHLQKTNKWTIQAYFAIADDLWSGTPPATGVAMIFLLLSAMVILLTEGTVRALALVTILLIIYTAAITSLMNILIPRYTSPMSVLYSIHSALILYAIIVLLQWILSTAQRRFSTSLTT